MKNCQILVCGERGVGKTTFFAALASCSQININRFDGKKTFTLEGKDKKTKKRLEGLIKGIQTSGNAPPATDRLTTFNLLFSYRGGLFNLFKKSIEICWIDTVGEEHHVDSIPFLEKLQLTRGIAVFIDGEKLAQSSSNLELKQLFRSAIVIAESIQIQKDTDSDLPQKPFVIIITKTDLADEIKRDNKSGREILHQNLKLLINLLEDKEIEFRIEYSATKIKEISENLYEIENLKTYAFLSWLTNIDLFANENSFFEQSNLLTKEMYASFVAILVALLGTGGLVAWNLINSPSHEPSQIDVLERG